MYALQFHGNENEKYLSNFGEFKTWKAMSIKVDLDAAENKLYELDKYQKDLMKLMILILKQLFWIAVLKE